MSLSRCIPYPCHFHHFCRTPHSAYKTNICESDSLYQRGHRIHLALQQSLVPNLGAKLQVRRLSFNPFRKKYNSLDIGEEKPLID